MAIRQFHFSRPERALAPGESWVPATAEQIRYYSATIDLAKEPGWVVSHEGLVVYTGERNYHDDSDFYATVYDPEKDGFVDVEYATTRGWTYANGADVDAPEELQERYRREGTLFMQALARLRAEEAAREPRKGRVVKAVRTFKSKGKTYPVGTEFEIFWVGQSYGKTRLGLEPVLGPKGEGRLFTAASNVEVIVGIEVDA